MVVEKPSPRFLGFGKVKQVFKNYMFVTYLQSQIYVPKDAVSYQYGKNVDLRDIFHDDDDVVFTAKKVDGTKTTIASLIKRCDLATVKGKVVEKAETYAFVDVPKLGRIFAPYSARTGPDSCTRPWHGKNADIGKVITLKVLPQPEYVKCVYVAWAVYPDCEPENCNKFSISSNPRLDNQPDSISKQLGIVIYLPSDDGTPGMIYSQSCGIIAFDAKVIKTSKLEMGYFVFVDAIKKISEDYEKCSLEATCVKVIGLLPYTQGAGQLSPNNFSSQNADFVMTITVHAVVCRIGTESTCAWLWNDGIGRLYVNSQHYTTGLQSMGVVAVKAQFTATFEDVPWSVVSIRPVVENANVTRSLVSQLLVTSDAWETKYVNESTAFYGFLEHPDIKQAFMAWTDLSGSPDTVFAGVKCRVTACRQIRDKRHPWRAILVTPITTPRIDDVHPSFRHTGNIHPSILAEINRGVEKFALEEAAAAKQIQSIIIPSATTPLHLQLKQQSFASKDSHRSSSASLDSGRGSTTCVVNGDNRSTDSPPGLVRRPIGAERCSKNGTDSPPTLSSTSCISTYNLWTSRIDDPWVMAYRPCSIMDENLDYSNLSLDERELLKQVKQRPRLWNLIVNSGRREI